MYRLATRISWRSNFWTGNGTFFSILYCWDSLKFRDRKSFLRCSARASHWREVSLISTTQSRREDGLCLLCGLRRLLQGVMPQFNEVRCGYLNKQWDMGTRKECPLGTR